MALGVVLVKGEGRSEELKEEDAKLMEAGRGGAKKDCGWTRGN